MTFKFLVYALQQSSTNFKLNCVIIYFDKYQSNELKRFTKKKAQIQTSILLFF